MLLMRRKQEIILIILIVFEMKYLLMSNCERGFPQPPLASPCKLQLLKPQSCVEVKKVDGSTKCPGFVSWLCCFLAGQVA